LSDSNKLNGQSTIPRTKLFGNGHQRVLSGNLHGGFSKKTTFESTLCQSGILNKDPTIWLDGARQPPTYISKHIKVKIIES